MANNPVVRGTLDSVPCPHCGKPNDYRILHEQQLLDTGHLCSCDHCGRMMEVARIAPMIVVSVREPDPDTLQRYRLRHGGGGQPQPHQLRGRVIQQQPAPQQQRGIGGVIRGLLGGPKK